MRIRFSEHYYVLHHIRIVNLLMQFPLIPQVCTLWKNTKFAYNRKISFEMWYHCGDGSVVKGLRQRILFSFVSDKPPGFKVFCGPEILHYKKSNKSALKTKIFSKRWWPQRSKIQRWNNDIYFKFNQKSKNYYFIVVKQILESLKLVRMLLVLGSDLL